MHLIFLLTLFTALVTVSSPQFITQYKIDHIPGSKFEYRESYQRPVQTYPASRVPGVASGIYPSSVSSGSSAFSSGFPGISSSYPSSSYPGVSTGISSGYPGVSSSVYPGVSTGVQSGVYPGYPSSTGTGSSSSSKDGERVLVVEDLTNPNRPNRWGQDGIPDFPNGLSQEDVVEANNPFSHLIGGLFEPGSEAIEEAFNRALDDANEKRSLGNIRLRAKADLIDWGDAFQASQKLCPLLKAKVLALFGPQSQRAASYVQSFAAYMEIPHLDATVDFKPPENHSLNFMPSPYVMIEAYRDLVRRNQWDSFAIVYDSDAALRRIQEFLTDADIRNKNVMIRRSTASDDRAILNEIKIRGVRNLILDMPYDRKDSRLSYFMGAALDEGMTSKYYNYIVTADLENARTVPVEATVHSFSLLEYSDQPQSLAAALTYDAISHLVLSLAKLNARIPLEKHNLTCRSTDGWAYGHEIRETLVNTVSRGLTGEIRFDENGIRSDFQLRLLKNTNDGMQTIATWDPKRRFRDAKDSDYRRSPSFNNNNYPGGWSG